MFKLEIKKSEKGVVEKLGERTFYNTDGKKSLQDWVKAEGRNTVVAPNLSSALMVKPERATNKKLIEGSIGSINNHGNNQQAQNYVYIASSAVAANGHKSITPENFGRAMVTFAVRKLLPETWDSQNMSFFAPNVDHEAFEEFELDSLIYGLFHSASQQSSLRKVGDNGQWDVKNEFFFMGKEEVKNLADANGYAETYSESLTDNERFVYLILSSDDIKLSVEAQEVLDIVRELNRLSFKYRKDFNKEKPAYQIMNWDCGWYQIRGLVDWSVEKRFDAELKAKREEFKKAYASLSVKMQPKVRELGFILQ